MLPFLLVKCMNSFKKIRIIFEMSKCNLFKKICLYIVHILLKKMTFLALVQMSTICFHSKIILALLCIRRKELIKKKTI